MDCGSGIKCDPCTVTWLQEFTLRRCEIKLYATLSKRVTLSPGLKPRLQQYRALLCFTNWQFSQMIQHWGLIGGVRGLSKIQFSFHDQSVQGAALIEFSPSPPCLFSLCDYQLSGETKLAKSKVLCVPVSSPRGLTAWRKMPASSLQFKLQVTFFITSSYQGSHNMTNTF